MSAFSASGNGREMLANENFRGATGGRRAASTTVAAAMSATTVCRSRRRLAGA